ncbi:MAG: hypothetical protein PVI50_02790 [Gammaproteobacteria bacterium]|jgi:hypothetical protein
MTERRIAERRSFDTRTRFPLFLGSGCVAAERRYRPSRRLNDISVNEVDCMDYISEIIKREG